jgi:hypothetical protein
MAAHDHAHGFSLGERQRRRQGDAGALAIAGSRRLGAVRSLEMFGNEFGAPGREALKKRFGAALKL